MYGAVGRSEGLHNLLAVTVAELRSVRRLARTWVFLALGIAVVGTAFGYYSYLHSTISFASLSGGNTLPRFTTAYFNSYVLWFFMAAMVFLAFDLRHRDERERVAEVVDSHPLSNVALIGGRLCAVVFAICLPLLGVLLLVQAVGTIGRAVGWWVDPIEPVATFTFFFRGRGPGLDHVVRLRVPARRRSTQSPDRRRRRIGGPRHSHVELRPRTELPATRGFTPLHPRQLGVRPSASPARSRNVPAPRLPFDACGGVRGLGSGDIQASRRQLASRACARRHRTPAVLAALGIGLVVLRCVEAMQLRDTWLEAHQTASSEPAPLVEHLAGRITIDPGATAKRRPRNARE